MLLPNVTGEDSQLLEKQRRCDTFMLEKAEELTSTKFQYPKWATAKSVGFTA